MESQDEIVARHGFVPGMQHASDPVALIDRIPQQNVGKMRKLQRQKIARMVHKDSVPCFYGTVEITVNPLTYYANMPPLPLIRGAP